MGDVHTGFIQQHYDTLFPNLEVSENRLIQAGIAVVMNDHNTALLNAIKAGYTDVLETNFRVTHKFKRDLNLKFGEETHKITVQQEKDGFKVRVDDGKWREVKTEVVRHAERFSLRVNIDGSRSNFSAVICPENVAIFNEVNTQIQ